MITEKRNNRAARDDYRKDKTRVASKAQKIPRGYYKWSKVIDVTYAWCRTFFKVVYVCRKSLGVVLRPYADAIEHHCNMRTPFSTIGKYERGEYTEVSLTNLYKHIVTIDFLAKKHGVVLFDKEYAFEDWYLGRCRNADGVLYTDLYNQLRGIEAENNESDSDKKP